MNLEAMPKEILLKIARDLDVHTAIQWSQTSKRFKATLDDNDLWTYYVDRDYSKVKHLISSVNNRKDFIKQVPILELHVAFLSLPQFIAEFSNMNRHDGVGFHCSFGRALRMILTRYNEALNTGAKVEDLFSIHRDLFKTITDPRVNIYDDTVLTYLTRKNLTEACLTMIKAGANVDEGTKLGGYPLAAAAANENMIIFRAMMRKKPKLEVLDGISETPLCYAAEYGNMTMLSELLAAGADPNFPSFYGTPINMAANSNQPLVIEKLYLAGAKVNSPSSSGFTPLMNAAINCPLEAVVFLIRAGAYLDDLNERNLTALGMVKAAEKALLKHNKFLPEVIAALNQAESFMPVKFALRYSQNKAMTEEFKKQHCGKFKKSNIM